MLDKAGIFVIKSFHIFLMLLVLVGWAILPTKDLIPLILMMGSIPFLWVLFDGNCILTSMEEELSGVSQSDGFINNIVKPMGVEIDAVKMNGILMLILAFSCYLVGRRIIIET
jgi:hypothetical protein